VSEVWLITAVLKALIYGAIKQVTLFGVRKFFNFLF